MGMKLKILLMDWKWKNGEVICELSHKTFDDYRKEPFNELSDIEDDILESDIEETYEMEQFLDYQKDFWKKNAKTFCQFKKISYLCTTKRLNN